MKPVTYGRLSYGPGIKTCAKFLAAQRPEGNMDSLHACTETIRGCTIVLQQSWALQLQGSLLNILLMAT